MNEKIFRYYDIRGVVGKDFFPADAYEIGHALAVYFLERDPDLKTVVVAMDGRDSSEEIINFLTQALLEAGLDVRFIGVVPTPVMYFALFHHNFSAGIMITASHNGPAYNGMKICFDKKPVAVDEMLEVKKLWQEGVRITGVLPGVYEEYLMHEEYITWLAEHFAALKNVPLKVIIDCSGGATATIIPQLITKMGWDQIEILNGEIDPFFSCHLPDPTDEKNVEQLKSLVQDYDVGVAFDGDGDRMVPMLSEGTLVSGDKMLALFVRPLLKQFGNFPVIFDIKSSSKLVDLLSQWGVTPLMCPTGHALIKKAMHDHRGVIAGEISCHFFFADRYYGFDDGIYAFMRLVELLYTAQSSLQNLLSVFPSSCVTPELRIACLPDMERVAVDAIKNKYRGRPDVVVNEIDGARVEFADGWALIRASNTEPVVTLRFEAENNDALLRQKKEFADVLHWYVDEHILKEKLLV